MGFFNSLLRDLPLYLLSLPVILMALSVHESAHGYVAYRLGDPTARNLGRITLNPVKHFDLLGFICMVFLHFGWAKPVPVVTRNFRKPRRDMALTGAAGPISNLLLAILHLLVLRVAMLFITPAFKEEAINYLIAYDAGIGFKGSLAFTVIALLCYILYMGVIMNVVLAVFNLIPVPPFDGSRIFYVFLPTKWYFGVMKYERYIILAIYLLLILGVLQKPLAIAEEWVINGLFTAVGMNGRSEDYAMLGVLHNYVRNLIRIG